jgi:phage terminase small subunit
MAVGRRIGIDPTAPPALHRGSEPILPRSRSRIATWQVEHQVIVMLSPKQACFVEEYLIDLNGTKAAIRVGYSARTAEVQASRLLRNAKVQVALEDAIQARSKRTEVTADRVVTEFARLAFANMRDYWPRTGETIDLHRLDQDRTAAVEEVTIDEAVDMAGVVHRRTRLKLHDKKGALDSLARHLGLFVDRHVVEGIEHRVKNMSSEERLQLAADILEEGRKLLPLLDEAEAQSKPKRSSHS